MIQQSLLPVSDDPRVSPNPEWAEAGDIDPFAYRRITGAGAVSFFVAGRPKPKERGRIGRNKATGQTFIFTPKATVDHEAVVAAMAQPHFPRPFLGVVALEIVTVWPMPASWSRKKRAEMLGRVLARRPDWDNTGKAIADALNGVAYVDDNQVGDGRVVRVWGVHNRSLVCVEELGPVA